MRSRHSIMGVGWLGSGSCRVVGHAWIDPATNDVSPQERYDIASMSAPGRTVTSCQRCGATNEPRSPTAGYQPRHLRVHVAAAPPAIERRFIAAPRSGQNPVAEPITPIAPVASITAAPVEPAAAGGRRSRLLTR